MKLTLFILAFYATFVAASWGFHEAPEYENWDTQQISRWLDENKVYFKDSQPRDDLLGLVRKHWTAATSSSPFATWDNHKLVEYLEDKGVKVKNSLKSNHEWLITTAQKNYRDTEAKVQREYDGVVDHVLNTWSYSDLDKFLDAHKLKHPLTASKKDLIDIVKDNADTFAKAAKTSTKHTYDWLFDTWSDTDLASWLVENGYDVPKKYTRKDLIRSIKKHVKQGQKGSKAAYQYLADTIVDSSGLIKDTAFDTWSESDLKAWFDEHGIAVPQNSKYDELLALARRNKFQLQKDIEDVNRFSREKYGHAADRVKQSAEFGGRLGSDAFKQIADTWSDSRLRKFLQARGVLAPDNTPSDRLRELVWSHKNVPVSSSAGAWSFEAWSADDLQNWLREQGQAVTGTRDELAEKASDYIESIKNQGGDSYQIASQKVADWYHSSKDSAFQSWSDSDLKSFLDSYGIPTYQGTTRNELIAIARRNAYLFHQGVSNEGWIEKVNDYFRSVVNSATSGTQKLSEKIQENVNEKLKQFRQEL
ncbi:hypothetical protein V1514DRAFT_328779 [Lipomyces japonicus]|uniref:uncharacterized protein n=1 Tax=Lipomyces japonicus TaxID=56871 RepID=UPI0034CD7EB7